MESPQRTQLASDYATRLEKTRRALQKRVVEQEELLEQVGQL